MIESVLSLVMGVGASAAAAALMTLLRKWLEVRRRARDTLSVHGREIEIDTSKLDELKDLLTSIMGAPQVFIAYAFKDRDIAKRIASALKSRGIRTWMAEDEIRPGDKISVKIDEGLRQSGYLIALLSRASVESRWVQEEFRMAMSREAKGKWPKVIPVLVDDIIPPPYLRDKLYVDLRQDFNEGISRIENAVLSDSRSHRTHENRQSDGPELNNR